MCETRDLGIKWPHWHTLTFSDETRIDMRFVCPRDVKNMLLQRARSVYWNKWAAKLEHEELKEGAWLEPDPALLRKKVKENWNERIVMWPERSSWKEVGRKRDFVRYWLVGCKFMSSMPNGGRHRKAQALPLSRVSGADLREIPEAFRK